MCVGQWIADFSGFRFQEIFKIILREKLENDVDEGGPNTTIIDLTSQKCTFRYFRALERKHFLAFCPNHGDAEGGKMGATEACLDPQKMDF